MIKKIYQLKDKDTGELYTSRRRSYWTKKPSYKTLHCSKERFDELELIEYSVERKWESGKSETIINLLNNTIKTLCVNKDLILFIPSTLKELVAHSLNYITKHLNHKVNVINNFEIDHFEYNITDKDDNILYKSKGKESQVFGDLYNSFIINSAKDLKSKLGGK